MSFRWRSPVAGLASLVIGVGFGRYAYTALMPALILSGQLTASQAGYAAAANLAGYVLGALMAPGLARNFESRSLVRFGIAATILGLAASAPPWGFWWLSTWRFVVGVSAGFIMTCGTSLVLTSTCTGRLALASGIVFSGVGLGTALSGIAVPQLLVQGVSFAWLGVAIMGLLVAPVAWFGWPVTEATGSVVEARPYLKSLATLSRPARKHVIAYFLYGVGLMPHTIFWVDYVARGLGAGMEQGGSLWGLVGFGAVIGALVSSLVASRWGFRKGLIVGLPVFALGIALPVATTHIGALWISSLVFGFMIPGIPALISGRSRQLVSDESFPVLWGTMTAAVSIGQGVGGYMMAVTFDYTQNFGAVFITGALITLAATALCWTRSP